MTAYSYGIRRITSNDNKSTLVEMKAWSMNNDIECFSFNGVVFVIAEAVNSEKKRYVKTPFMISDFEVN